MDKFFHKHSLYIAIVVFVCSIVIFSSQSFAFGRPDSPTSENHEFSREGIAQRAPSGTVSPFPTQGEHPRFQKLENETSDASESGKSHMPKFTIEHLQGNKLEACQSVEKALTNRSSHLTTLVTQMEKTFNAIALGVEQYYLTKVVPTGNTLTNYDTLVANITTSQNALTPLVSAAQSDITNFSCTGNNPGAQMTQFKTDMQAVVKGLQDYRTSIKNLIVAVKTLPSVSPAVTETPSVTPTEIPTPIETVTPTVTP